MSTTHTSVRSPDTAELHHAASRKSNAAGTEALKSLDLCAARADGIVRRAQSEGAPESRDVRPSDRQSNAQRRTNAAWLRAQLDELTGWLESNPHRWPIVRIIAAHRGDDQWRMRAAEVLHG